MRRTIRYLGTVKKTFHFLFSLFENQTTTIRYTNNYSTRETLSVHVLFRCILPFFTYAFGWKKHVLYLVKFKNLFIPVLTLWFWVCSVFLSLPLVRFWPYPRTKWFLKTATMSCWRRMLIWSLVDYSSAEPLMPPGTNVLLSKQQLSDKIAFWFCDLLFR